MTDGTVFNFTPVVEWSLSSTTSASVDNASFKGLVMAAAASAPGQTAITTITAVDTVNHISSSITLNIRDPLSSSITPTNPHMYKGTIHQFLATLHFQDTTQDVTLYSTWAIASSAIATVTTNSPGVFGSGIVTALTTTGTTAIETSFNLSSGTTATSTQLIVTDAILSSITVTATPSFTIPISSQTQQLHATGNYLSSATTPTLDFTQSVIWYSSNIAAAVIDGNGLATRVSTTTATTTITATDPITNLSNSVILTVD